MDLNEEATELIDSKNNKNQDGVELNEEELPKPINSKKRTKDHEEVDENIEEEKCPKKKSKTSESEKNEIVENGHSSSQSTAPKEKYQLIVNGHSSSQFTPPKKKNYEEKHVWTWLALSTFDEYIYQD